MKTKKFLIFLITAAVLFSSMILPSFADLGYYSGDSDFGGSDWGSSDWGSSDWGGDYGGYGDDIYIIGDFDIGGVIVILIIIIALSVLKSKMKNGRVVSPGARPTDLSSFRSMSEYLSIDPQFSEESMKEKLSNLYVQMQNCCTARDISPLRPYLTDALYAQYERQTEALKTQGRTNYVDRISVMDVSLMGFKQDDVNDIIVARLKTRIVDYTLDDNTGKLVSGNQTAEKFMDYEWTLARKKGFVSGSEEETVNCPNCGAPVNINKTAQCEYCGSVLSVDNYDWVLTTVKAISQRTA